MIVYSCFLVLTTSFLTKGLFTLRTSQIIGSPQIATKHHYTVSERNVHEKSTSMPDFLTKEQLEEKYGFRLHKSTASQQHLSTVTRVDPVS